MERFHLPAIPAELQWRTLPRTWSADLASRLQIVAAERTDWFVDPATGVLQDNAPVALFTPAEPEFLLSARVKVDFAATFDAGSLQLRARDDLWAKLCFEYSPAGEPMIVSVVTRGLSDDCNSTIIAGNEVFLRVAVTSATLAFHFSIDGRKWSLARYFSLGHVERWLVGFSAQSPQGDGCAVEFDEITWQPRRLSDIRHGE
jgi:regulation of enolase protein 1 (concanavalin A-like superfamily)